MSIRVLTFGVCACALAVAALAQEKKPGNEKPVIVVKGCVEGSWLKVKSVDTAGVITDRFRLRGGKQLMKEISSTYNGHLIEVTGAVTDTADTTHTGKVVNVGKKTRINVGAKEVPQVPSGNDPTLEVRSYKDLNERCK